MAAVVRYAVETDDPWLADLVRRADDGEPIIDSVDFSLEPRALESDLSEDRIEALAEIICRTGEEAAAALFVLLGTLENSTHPKRPADAAKHVAFTRCAEANLFGIVDAHIAVVESELLAEVRWSLTTVNGRAPVEVGALELHIAGAKSYLLSSRE